MKRKLSREAGRLKKGILKAYAITDDAGVAILESAVEAFDLMHAAQEVVDKEGLTVPGARGQLQAHPLLAVIRDQRAQFLAALKSLNLDIEPLRDGPGRPAGR